MKSACTQTDKYRKNDQNGCLKHEIPWNLMFFAVLFSRVCYAKGEVKRIWHI